MEFKPTIEMFFWFIGGLNTIIVLLAFINKPIRKWFFDKFRKGEEIQNSRIIAVEKN